MGPRDDGEDAHDLQAGITNSDITKGTYDGQALGINSWTGSITSPRCCRQPVRLQRFLPSWSLSPRSHRYVNRLLPTFTNPSNLKFELHTYNCDAPPCLISVFNPRFSLHSPALPHKNTRRHASAQPPHRPRPRNTGVLLHGEGNRDRAM